MPERVTREERTISMAIEKARSAKEILYNSLMDNNRNPMEDKSEAVKVKRPKAEKDTTKFESNDGPTSLHAYAGDITKAIKVLKAVKESDYRTNPFLDEEQRMMLIEEIDRTEEALSDIREQINNADDPSDLDKLDRLFVALSSAITSMERRLDKIPEQTMRYDSEYSSETLDPDYERTSLRLD
jgi:hypothetical protein